MTGQRPGAPASASEASRLARAWTRQLVTRRRGHAGKQIWRNADGHREVTAAIPVELPARGFRPNAVSRAQALWGDFVEAYSTNVQKPINYVAGVAFTIDWVDRGKASSTYQTAEQFGVSQSAVYRVFAKIFDGLGLRENWTQYTAQGETNGETDRQVCWNEERPGRAGALPHTVGLPKSASSVRTNATSDETPQMAGVILQIIVSF